MRDRSLGVNILFRIICLMFSAVLIVSIFRVAFNGNSISFAGFLNYISNCPSIDVEYSVVAHVAGSWPDWALWLRAIIEVFCGIINVVWWIMRNIANLLTFIVYFLGYLFV